MLTQPKQPQLQQQTVDYEKGIADFVEKAFRRKMPALIDFTMNNRTIMKLLRHLKRHATGSTATAYQYVYGVWRWHLWLNNQPDKILAECYGAEGEPLPKMLAKHAQVLDDFVGHLQELGLAPGTVSNHVKGVKQLYRASGLMLDLPRYPRTVRYPGRAPTLQEVGRILRKADYHERLVVLLIATGGFREGTLSQLKYGNVREDLERKVEPVLVTVQPAITKGQGWETSGYWTFLPHETIEALNDYLDERRHGGRWFQPETITDNSPLLRNRSSGKVVRPITPGAIWATVNQLYLRAGVIKPCPNQQNHRRKGPACKDCGYPDQNQKRQKLCAHSLRWFFRTQLTSQGVNPEYCEFLMGHKGKLYNDVRSKGPEFLRAEYMKADLSTTPKPKMTDRQVIEALLRGRGFDPGKILRADAFSQEGYSEPHRIIVSPEDQDEMETRRLTEAFVKSVFQDGIPSTSSAHYGSPGEIRTPVGGSLPFTGPKPAINRVIA